MAPHNTPYLVRVGWNVGGIVRGHDNLVSLAGLVDEFRHESIRVWVEMGFRMFNHDDPVFEADERG